MIRLEDLGVGKIGVHCENSSGAEIERVNNAITGVGGAFSKRLGRYFHESSLVKFFSLIEGVVYEMDDGVRAFLMREHMEVEERIEALDTRMEWVSERLLKLEKPIKPMPHQLLGARWLTERKKAILADDPGVGKTFTVCFAIPDNLPVIIESPSMGLGVWEDHLIKARPDYTPVVITTEKDFRLPKQGEALIIPRGVMPPCLKEIEMIRKEKKTVSERTKKRRLEAVTINAYAAEIDQPFVLIADEAHHFKTTSSQQTMRHRILMKSVINAGGFVWLITGTPLMNKPMDLWGVLGSMGSAAEVFGGWQAFVNAFEGKQGPFGGLVWPQDLDTEKLSGKVVEKLRPVILRRTFEQVRPDLPESRRHILRVPMSKVKDTSVWKALDEATRALEEAGITIDEMLRILEKGNNAGKKLPVNPFTLRMMMAATKIPIMMELVAAAEDEGEPLVVASAHSAPLEALASRPGWAVITGETDKLERNKIEKDFQAGKYKGVGLSIQAGGLAISLHRANRMLFVDLEWTPGENFQAEQRIRRVVSDKGCVYTILALDHDYEIKTYEALLAKAAIINATINVLAEKDSVSRSEQLGDLVHDVFGPQEGPLLQAKDLEWGSVDRGFVDGLLRKPRKELTSVELLMLGHLVREKES